MEPFTVDFIVVGAGSAGAALASRLTRERAPSGAAARGRRRDASPRRACPSASPSSSTAPASTGSMPPSPRPTPAGARIPVPRGRMLGGSSAINGMVWVRGQRAGLRPLGPARQPRLELPGRAADLQGAWRATPAATARSAAATGRIKVTDIDESGRLYDSFFAAAETHRPQAQPRLQRRRPGRHRHDAGLDQPRPAHEHGALLPRSRAPAREPHHRDQTRLAESLILEGRRCVGVRYSVARPEARGAGGPRGDRLGRRHRLAAAAGAVRHRPGASACKGARHRGPPRPARRRREPARPLGAAHEVARRPPRRHLQRACPRPRAACGKACSTSPPRKGFLSHPASPMRAFFKTREGLDSPDAMFTVQPFLMTPDLKLAKEAGHHHHHPSAAPREQGQRPRDGRRCRQAAGDPLQLPGRAHRPRLRARLHAHRAAHGRGAAAGLARRRGVRARPQGQVGRRAPRLRAPARPRPPTIPVGTCRMGSDAGRRRRRPPARARHLPACASPTPRSCRR